ncbi:MAG TPA: hypothetical protein VJ890_05310, partial [Vineibacter sp.]|nr:hypothetical protein [Vineibacter sp.]
ALAEHRDKPDAPALRIVRDALLALRTTATEPDDGAVGPPRRQPRPPGSAAKPSAAGPRLGAPKAASGARFAL